MQDNITLVTGFFRMKSKHKFNEYLIWVNNLLKINCSLVFFIDKSISQIIKQMRPKIYKNKTIWIETNINDFYSYKHFIRDFINTKKLDFENYHTVPLYLIWAEKCFFVKKAIKRNYFNSKCFYWIDAGFFRNNDVNNYLNGWPSSKKCFEDPRVIMVKIREIPNEEIQKLKRLDSKFYYYNFIKLPNVGGTMFGGKRFYFLKFISLYYKIIKRFIKYKLFIGKDQNLFAYIAYFNKDFINLVYSRDYRYFKSYLSPNYSSINMQK